MNQSESNSIPITVVPGETIVETSKGFMAGRGTYEVNGRIVSSIVGKVAQISKLITVVPMKSPFSPEVGDVIIGRIISVEKKYWRVNIYAQREGILNLTAINLPQGEQRIRSEEDAMQMRNYFKENDLLSGEIQQINLNGTIHVQTRNLKYGKLKNGMMIKVNHGLVKKKKNQFVDLDCDVKAILGMNGIIWVYYSTVKVENEYFTDDKMTVNTLDKEEEINANAARLIVLFKNIIASLDEHMIEITHSNIMEYYHLYLKIIDKDNNKGNEKEKDMIKTAFITKDIDELVIKSINDEKKRKLKQIQDKGDKDIDELVIKSINDEKKRKLKQIQEKGDKDIDMQ